MAALALARTPLPASDRPHRTRACIASAAMASAAMLRPAMAGGYLSAVTTAVPCRVRSSSAQQMRTLFKLALLRAASERCCDVEVHCQAHLPAGSAIGSAVAFCTLHGMIDGKRTASRHVVRRHASEPSTDSDPKPESERPRWPGGLPPAATIGPSRWQRKVMVPPPLSAPSPRPLPLRFVVVKSALCTAGGLGLGLEHSHRRHGASTLALG